MFLSRKKLERMGFKHLGKGVLISHKASIYNAKNISIGDYSRIDDFCVLSAGTDITIGNYVHIACYASIIGKGRVEMADYSGISARVCIFSSSDNYNGEYMTNPCLPDHVLNTYHRDVKLGRHVVVGAGSVILAGVTLGDGCAVGAMSMVKTSWPANSILVGVPVKQVSTRKPRIYELEKRIPPAN